MILHLKEIFSGHYNFIRTISNPSLVLEGTSQFIKVDQNNSLYIEEGTYVLNKGTQEFYQQYEYKWKDETLYIFSHLKTILHTFNFKKNKTLPLVVNHQHFCKSDIYDLILTLLSPNAFEMHYKVNGPEKNYEIKTQYTRRIQ